MFIRVLRSRERKELLLNMDHVTKIEVEYAVEGPDGVSWQTSLEEGHTRPEAFRYYRVFVGGEVVLLAANPLDPVIKVLEEIYKGAIRGDALPAEPDTTPDDAGT